MALTPPDLAYVAAMEADARCRRHRSALVPTWCASSRRSCARCSSRSVQRHRAAAPYAPSQAQIGPRRLAQRRAALPRRPRRRGRARAGDRAVRRRRQHDRHDRRARRDQGQRCARAPRPVRALRGPLARRAAGARQVVRARSDARSATARSIACKSLLAHPRFNARNPNRVRSLVGAFALRNFARFNAVDGGGYSFVAEQVLALDPANPQLASSIAGAFNLWKRFPEPRRAQMKAALERIANGADAFAGRGRDRFAHAGGLKTTRCRSTLEPTPKDFFARR